MPEGGGEEGATEKRTERIAREDERRKGGHWWAGDQDGGLTRWSCGGTFCAMGPLAARGSLRVLLRITFLTQMKFIGLQSRPVVWKYR